MNARRFVTREDAAHAVRGFLMGAADTVPGVSGGTVALIVGIYSRLVTAISHFDVRLLGYLRTRRWEGAARHVDLRFVAALGMGILVGGVSLASLMHYLLEFHMSGTLAVFFGLIVASSWLVARQVEFWSAGNIAAGIVAAAGAFALCGLLPSEAEMTPGYLFLCAMIAICAMILPGISGAFVLLILGMYHNILGVIKEVASGHLTFENLTALVVFASGCAIGLAVFSRLLKALLTRYEALTMTILCGFMLGSLRRVWPFKIPAADYPADTPFRRIHFENVLPPWDVTVATTILLAVAGFTLVMFIDWIACRDPASPLQSPATMKEEVEHIEA